MESSPLGTLTVFAGSPDRGRGLARDMTVRWALEELGLPYRVRPVAMADLQRADHLSLQPFGQIPAYEDAGIVLFETGAIVLHLAGQRPGLLPTDQAARARTISWMFAAANTLEPPVIHLETAGFAYAGQPWEAAAYRPLEDVIGRRLAALDRHLAGRDWLEEDFSAGDLLMIQVLRRLGGTGLTSPHPCVLTYVARGEDRPAFRRAFAAQLETYRSTTPAGNPP